MAAGATVLSGAESEVGTHVVPPSQRGYGVQAIKEAGERGGMLLPLGTNFTAAHNRAMGGAIELWNAHRWEEGVGAFRQIWQGQPESPWAAEAELHEACYLKYNARYDEAEERFLSVLNKHPNSPEIQNKVLRYLPHLYAQTGRYQAGLDLLEEMKKLPLGWQERQYIENYSRIFARAKGKDDADRLCGTKALALALAAQNDRGETLRNVGIEGALKRHAWAGRKSSQPEGFSLQELADLDGAQAVELDVAELRAAAEPGHPVLVHLKAPAAPKCFTFFPPKAHPAAKPLSGHFVVVEKITDSYVDLLDPDLGRTRWALAHFQYRWSGAALRLAKQNNIHGKPVSREHAQVLRGGCCGSPPPDPNDDPCGGDGGDGGGGGFGGFGGFGGGCEGCKLAAGTGAPVYSFGLSSANLVLKDIPMWSTAGKGPEMAIQLIYNRIATQRMATNGTNVQYHAFGDKWHFNYFSHLTETPNSGVDIVLPGGKVQRFDTSYAPVDIWNRNTLTRTNDHFILEFHGSGNKWYYNTNVNVEQHLEKIEDKYGDALTLQYEASSGRLTNVVDALNRSFLLAYNASGYVTNVADSFGRNARFAYQGSDLVSLTDMGGLTTTIQYDANHWPTNITYPSGESWHVYYQQGAYGYSQPFRMVVTDPLGQTNEYFYHAFWPNGPITVKDRAGNNWLMATERGWDYDSSKQRVVYRGVNAQVPGGDTDYSDQWVYDSYDDVDRNLVRTDQANSNHSMSSGGYGYDRISDVTVTNLYDGNHNLLSSTTLTNCVLDSYGALLSADYVGTWTNWYDARDNRLGSMNPLNQVTRYAYDTNDNLTAVTNALDQLTRMAYDAKGNLTNLIDALNRTNAWTYDANSRQFESYYADGLKMSKGYDTVGRLGSVTNHGSGLYQSYFYDDLNRMRDVVFPDGTSNHFDYSCCGLDWTRDRLNRVTSYGRDAIGRTTSVTDPENRVTGFGYNGADQITRLTTTVGGEQRVKKFDYTSTNGASRLTKVTTPMGKLIKYDYTFRGGLAWRQDGNGNVTKYQYDPLERLVSVTDSNNVVLVKMDYNVLGNVTHVASTNSVFDYTYDSLNRATQAVCLLTNIPNFATVKYKIDYAFDPVGNVTNRVITGLQGMTETITTRYAYDMMNRLTNVVQTKGSTSYASASYQYDSAGRLWKKTHGNGDVVTHAYDQESRLLSLGITNNTTLVTRYNYQWDAGGNILAITNNGGANVLVSRYQYDAAGQLTNEVCSTNGIAGGATNSWQYDEAGNWLNADGSSRWVYDRDNELMGRTPTAAATNTVVTVTGTVTNNTNLKSNKWYHSTAECRSVSALVSSVDGTFSLPGVPLYPGTNALLVTVTDVSGNTSQQVRTVAKTNALETFQYDGNGNLTNWVSGTTNWVYEWDWADRLTKVRSNDVVVLENAYDASSRRIAKTEVVNGQMQEWLYLSDGWDIVGVMDASGQLLETYTRGVGLAGDIGTLVAVNHHPDSSLMVTYYTHANQRGDVTLTRLGTETVGTYDYSAFGTLKSQTGADACRFKFSSKERDVVTGFSYYGFRFYAPQWQRWLSRDPIGERGWPEVYSFVANDPTDVIDVWGLEPMSCQAVGDLIKDNNQSGLDDAIIKCIAYRESGFRPTAKNKTSTATGLMQMTEGACIEVGCDHLKMIDPAEAIRCGSKYVARRVKWAKGNVTKGLDGYGTGSGSGYGKAIQDCADCLKKNKSGSKDAKGNPTNDPCDKNCLEKSKG